jgi:hypothetical protein
VALFPDRFDAFRSSGRRGGGPSGGRLSADQPGRDGDNFVIVPEQPGVRLPEVEEGVLTLTVPELAAARPPRIAIR